MAERLDAARRAAEDRTRRLLFHSREAFERGCARALSQKNGFEGRPRMAPPSESARGRVVFVSDWHLPAEQTPQTALFIRFVEEVCSGAERVFVLGDLFAAWVGPRHAARPGHAAVLKALRRLAASGTSVTLLRGNRDFLLDRKTARRFGLDLASTDWRGEIGGRKVLLLHGDEWSEDDRLHKTMRAITGNFPVSTIVKAMPLCASDVLAGFYRRLSDRRRLHRKRKKLRPAPEQLKAEARRGTDLVVIGHWHEPAIRSDCSGLKTFVMLGECTETEASYAELADGAVELRSFPARTVGA